MPDSEEVPETGDSSPRSKSVSPRIIVLLVVLAVLGGVVAAKMMAPITKPTTVSANKSLTSVRNDAVADYNAAKTGKPVYVLFHSLT